MKAVAQAGRAKALRYLSQRRDRHIQGPVMARIAIANDDAHERGFGVDLPLFWKTHGHSSQIVELILFQRERPELVADAEQSLRRALGDRNLERARSRAVERPEAEIFRGNLEDGTQGVG